MFYLHVREKTWIWEVAFALHAKLYIYIYIYIYIFQLNKSIYVLLLLFIQDNFLSMEIFKNK